MKSEIVQAMVWLLPFLLTLLIGVVVYAYNDTKGRAERHIESIFKLIREIQRSLTKMEASNEAHIEEIAESKKHIERLFAKMTEHDIRIAKLEK